MSETPEEIEKRKKAEKAVNKGVVYGIGITLLYLAYNFFRNSNDHFNLTPYIVVFIVSSTVLSFIFMSDRFSKNDKEQ